MYTRFYFIIKIGQEIREVMINSKVQINLFKKEYSMNIADFQETDTKAKHKAWF